MQIVSRRAQPRRAPRALVLTHAAVRAAARDCKCSDACGACVARILGQSTKHSVALRASARR